MTGNAPSDPTPSDSALTGPALTGPAPSGPTLDALVEAGFGIHALTEEQHQVLRALTAEELALLIDIKGRLDEVSPEVQAHSEVAGGALF